MAKISVLNIDPENEALYWAALKPQDRFAFSRVTMKQTLLSRKRIKGLTQRSLLPTIALMWNELTLNQQAAWSSAAAYSNTKGYLLFIQDCSYRITHAIGNASTPSDHHQVKVGEIVIAAPASAIELIQLHPQYYYKLHKVAGTKNQYEPIKVEEIFTLPISLTCSYKSNLEVVGDNPFAQIYAKVVSSYQGIDRENFCVIDFDLVADWNTVSASLTELLGHYIRYDLYIKLQDVRGTLLFDNVLAEHGAVNWARDPHCNSIKTTFTKAFYQIPKNWAPLVLNDGAEYNSIYPE